MTVKQAAKAMNVHPSSIYRRIWQDGLPCRRPLKRRILIAVEDLEKWRQETLGPEYHDRRN